MIARLFAGGFLLLELLALAFLAGSGGSAVWADPNYNREQLRAKCEDEATDCGSVCFYANCAVCDKCCTCWETCERERCRSYRCRCRTYTDEDGSRYRDCDRCERCTTTYYRCRFHTRTNSIDSCNGGGGVDCISSSSWWDCPECLRWEWLLFQGRNTAGDKHGRRDFSVTSQTLQQAVDLALQPVAATADCLEQGATTQVTPIPGVTRTPGVTTQPNATVPILSTPRSPGSWTTWPTTGGFPPFSLPTFPRESLAGTMYGQGPTLSLTRRSDNSVELRIAPSVRELRKQPERCLDPDPDGGACRRWETELSRAGQTPPGYRLRYRRYIYSGLARPGPEYGGVGGWQAVPVDGKVPITVQRPGFWAFEAMQDRLDGSEPVRSVVRVTALGYAAAVAQVRSDRGVRDDSGRVWSPSGGSTNPAGGLSVPPTATPLPPLEGGLSRPPKPGLSGARQDFTATGRVELTLTAAAAAGDVVEYRYWPHSGFLPDGDPRWNWRMVGTWVPGSRQRFRISDPSRWQRLWNGKWATGFWSFQVRVKRTVGGQPVYSEPSNARSIVIRGFTLPSTP